MFDIWMNIQKFIKIVSYISKSLDLTNSVRDSYLLNKKPH